MSDRQKIVGLESNEPHPRELRRPSYRLRTASGICIEVTKECYQDVLRKMGTEPLYLCLYISTTPGRDDDPIVQGDIMDVTNELAKIKKEAEELAVRLSGLARMAKEIAS